MAQVRSWNELSRETAERRTKMSPVEAAAEQRDFNSQMVFDHHSDLIALVSYVKFGGSPCGEVEITRNDGEVIHAHMIGEYCPQCGARISTTLENEEFMVSPDEGLISCLHFEYDEGNMGDPCGQPIGYTIYKRRV